MNPLSRRLVVARYCTSIVAMWVVALFASASISPGFLLFIVFAAFVSLKYLLFDSIVGMLRHRWPAFKILPWLWIGYGMVLAADLWATWLAVSDDSGSNLALAATVIVTPWILAVALIFMAIHTLIAWNMRKKRSRSR